MLCSAATLSAGLENLGASCDFLYWECYEDNLDELQKIVETDISSTTTHYKDRIKSPGFQPNVGYRLGVSYNDPCFCLDTQFLWTHFNTSGHKKDKGKNSTYLIAPLSSQAFEAQKVDYDVHVNLNVYDVEVGHLFCVNPCLDLRPFAGLRGAVVDQSGKVKASATDIKDKIHLENNYKGLGVRVGGEVKWLLGCNFSLYGNIAASLLWGNFHLRANEHFSDTDIDEGSDYHYTNRLRENFHSTKQIWDLGIGLSYKMALDCDQILEFRLGFEQHLFFGQSKFWVNNGFETSDRVKFSGDLAFQGLVFGLDYKF